MRKSVRIIMTFLILIMVISGCSSSSNKGNFEVIIVPGNEGLPAPSEVALLKYVDTNGDTYIRVLPEDTSNPDITHYLGYPTEWTKIERP